MTDLDLLRDYTDRADEAAFAELVRRHIGWVTSTARRLTMDPGSADDVAQAVFILLARKAKSLRRETVLSSWLFTVTRYAASSARRMEARRKAREREVAVMHSQLNASDELQWSQLAPVLDELVARLRSKDRRAILLRFYEQKSYSDIGAALSISEEAARKRVSRAVNDLKERFARRGVTAGATALAVAMSANLIPSASAAQTASATSTALSAAQGGAASADTLTSIVKATQAMLTWTTIKSATAVILAVLLATAAGTVALQLAPRQQTMSLPTTAPTPVAMANDPIGYGHVVALADGKAIAGARVILLQGDLVDGIHIAASVTTDANGRFRLPIIDDPNHPADTLLVQAPGYGLTGARWSDDATEDDPAEIEVRPTMQLRVKLVGPDDKPASGIRVSLTALLSTGAGRQSWIANLPDELQQQLTQTTDVEGSCTFWGLARDARCRLDIQDERFAHLSKSRPLSLDNESLSESNPIKLQLAASVSGRIVYSDSGHPVVGIRVEAGGMNTNPEIAGESAYTDENGNYAITRLRQGDYNIALDLHNAVGDEYTAFAHEAVRVIEGQRIQNMDFKLITGALIRGKATIRGTDRPVSGLHVFVYGPAHPRSSGWVQGTTTTEDGSYQLRVPAGAQYVYFPGPTPRGLRDPQPRSYDLTVQDGQTSTLNFELVATPGSSVTGHVVDAQGHPVGGANITLEHRNPGGDLVGEGGRPIKADAQGRFSIASMPRGLLLRANKGNRTTEPPVGLDGSNGDVTLAIRPMERTAALVRLLQPDGSPIVGAKVNLISQNNLLASGDENKTTDASGAVVFRSLIVTGNYTASYTAKGFGIGQVTLGLKPGKQNEQTITVPKAESFIAGLVLDEHQQPVPDVEVFSNGPRSGSGSTRTDASGHFRLDGIVAGDTPRVFVRIGNQALKSESVPAGTESAIITTIPPTTRPVSHP